MDRAWHGSLDAVSDLTSALAPGTQIGGFVIEALLGSGDIASVYRAYEPALDRRVALKVLAPAFGRDRDFTERLRREYVDVAQLQHPDVVAVYEAGMADDTCLVAMRLVTGSTLQAMLARRGRLRPDDAIAILERVARTLDDAHERGFVHGDLKPSNIFLEPGGRVSVADFGPSKATMGAAASSTAGAGDRPMYLAPEQVSARAADARSDVFSLACIMFECITGQPPYRLEALPGLVSVPTSGAAPSLTAHVPDVVPAVDTVFQRALSADPAVRPATAGRFVEELGDAFHGRAVPVAAANVVGGGTRVPSAPAEPEADRSGAEASSAPRAPGTAPDARTGEPSLLPSRPPATTRTHDRGVRARRPFLVAVGVVLLAALVGGIALLSFGSGGNNSPTLSTLAVNRTQVVFRAPLDNTASGFVDRTGRLPGDANVRPVPGALELTAGPGGDAGRDLALPTGVVDYLLAADIEVLPGSQVKLDFGLRWSRDSRVGDLLRIDAVEGTATFARFEKGATSSQSRIIAVGDQVKVAGLTTGAVQHLAIVVRGKGLALYRNGVMLVSTSDPNIPSAPTSPGIDVLGVPGRGTVRIVGLEIRTVPPA